MAGDNIAHVQDADEDGAAIGGTEKYARSIAPGSPPKERANSGKSRKDKMARRTSTSPQHVLTDSDDTTPPPASEKKERERIARRAREKEQEKEIRRDERRRLEKERERADRRERERERERQRERELRDRERAAAKKAASRPATKHTKTAPVVHTQRSDEYRRPKFQDEPSQYGIAPAHPRRPSSYYGPGSRPPPSNQQWHASQNTSPFDPSPVPIPYAPPSNASPFGPPAPPPNASSFGQVPTPSPFAPMPGQSPFLPGTSYPPPTGWAPGGMPYQQAPPPPPQSVDYFSPPPPGPPQHSNLAHRFQPRPASAMGHQTVPGSFEDDYEPTYEQENINRRQSLKIRHAEDRKLMPPPPPRSRTTVPLRPALRPPPPQRQIASAGYESEDVDDDQSEYQDLVPPGYDYNDGVVSRPRSHRRGSSAYSHDGYHIESAPPGRSSRRLSHLGSSGPTYAEQKYEDALAYQNHVSGGSGGVPLTAAALSRAAKKSIKSSKSSGSSASRNESEFRQSATTGITRSSIGDGDDFTIKVTGQAIVRLGNAEIQCQDGGEINISQPGRVGGSDKASTIYSEDHPGRIERLPIRDRASSQADSHSRSQSGSYEFSRPAFW
ncbi:hypothetical protein CCHL11_01294 [Colletotrichum chlorophyti]|uniref:Uncharacterized protein n=1 Tax=Colletotrichum chlorophyti TaxID=708187 RepID=A0A1Q8S7X8_9PEZI|nr:hypothetical protein CCHL11_01294 [Colletotrichum chlorophyti]